MQPTPPFSLEQLCDATGVKERTIRSWIKEGVLPAARGRGRGAYYGQDHMDRLLFIRRLREVTGSRLPLPMLRDIFDRLAAGDDPEVVHRVAQGDESLSVAGLTGPSGLVAEATRVHDVGLGRPSQAISFEMDDLEAVVEAPPAFHAAPVPAQASMPRLPRPGSAGAPWTTIQVSEDVELRLRGDEPERVAWLARLARKLRTWIREDET